jgi:hypothetical protein
MAGLGASQGFLHAAEIIDGIWLDLAVGIICLNSLGLLGAFAYSGWRAALKQQP